MQALSTAKSNGDSGPNPGYPYPHLGLCGAHKVFTHMGYSLGIWGRGRNRRAGTITGLDFLPGYKRVARKRAFIWVGG